MNKKWWLLLLLAGLLVLFFAFDLGRYLSLAAVKDSQADLSTWREANPLQESTGHPDESCGHVRPASTGGQPLRR